MAKRVRQIIRIDEDLCNGCGQCVTACAEGALQIIDGKARLVSETYCDGLGACLGECPQDALSFESREADDFDEAAAMEHVAASGQAVHAHNHTAQHAHHQGFVCPSAKTIDRTKDARQETSGGVGKTASELRQWPVKLYLVNPNAPYFENADLLIAADCVGFAYGGLHPDFMRGKTLVIGCPKFDDVALYAEKLEEILSANNIKSITVLQMDVPCCAGMQRLAEHAVAASGKSTPVDVVTISLSGEVKNACPKCACER